MLYLFDIDGTLIGGDGSGRRAFERACHDHMGILGALEHLRLDGMTDPLILESVFHHHHGRSPTLEETRAIFDVYVRHLEAEVAAGLYHVKPAVHDTLDLLEKRGETIGLATGNLEAGARIKLQRGELWHRFAFGGFGSDAAERAELVRVAIERGCTRAGRRFMRDEIWVIGDTPRDISAAHAAGARAVAVATGWYSLEQLTEAGADAVHPTMAEWLATL
ncbi:MAG: Haloacid dehalogenase domain protein hydrolase [Myxococcales bacterium]|nr:Haloacid dehalogenase domain protein hydrolase [Myxococcales bacterium]